MSNESNKKSPNPKFKIGQSVNIKYSKTFCKSGTIKEVQIIYTVLQDDGLTFIYDANNLEAKPRITKQRGRKMTTPTNKNKYPKTRLAMACMNMIAGIFSFYAFIDAFKSSATILLIILLGIFSMLNIVVALFNFTTKGRFYYGNQHHN
ncbi:MAG: hypothetical protein WC389_16335 [Lutibacter sp.]|jgi:hypothetical protein